MRELFREEYPECAVSLSCEVLPEYREYERAMTTLVDAFVKPHMGRYLQRIHDELGPDLRTKPFLVMQSSGGVISSEQVVNKPITTALSGPAAGALGAAVVAKIAGFEDLVTLDAGGTSTDLCLIEGGRAEGHQRRLGRTVPGAHPDDRHQDRRHRRRVDRVDQPRGPSQGRAEERRRGARADVLSGRAATSRRSPTRTSCSGGSRRR